jgi:hypothetical protein
MAAAALLAFYLAGSSGKVLRLFWQYKNISVKKSPGIVSPPKDKQIFLFEG